jgi:hypothetical protein
MEKTVVRYVGGIGPNSSAWEKKQHKKYANLANICRQIDYDMKHGVTEDQVLQFLHSVRRNTSFAKVRKNEGAIGRLDEVEDHYRKVKVQTGQAAPAQASQQMLYRSIR